jgi:plasmid maintenance system antidote protein VapI
MNAFASFLKNVDATRRAVAADLEVDASIVSRLARGEARPGLALAVRIARWSGGAVPVESWVDAPGEIAAPSSPAGEAA